MSDRGSALRIVLTLAVAGVACGHAEQKVIDNYFTAVNAADNQTLSSFAVVSLDTKGKKIDKWTIVSVSEEKTEPAPLPELVKKLKDAEAAQADNKRAAGNYNLDHYKEIEQVKELEKKNAKVSGVLSAVATEWEKFNQKDRDAKKATAEAKEGVDKEKRNVSLSVGQLDDMENLKGQVVTKQLELALVVGGEPKNYSMNLRRYELAPGSGTGRVISRWVIHSLTPKS